MPNRIVAFVFFAVFTFSCTSPAEEKQKARKAEAKISTVRENSSSLVYLDTAENMYNALCQGWVMEDDEDALNGMDENSSLIIPYRSFYFSGNGTFVKNPRNAIDYGNWDYDDEAKTITLHYTVEKGKDVYKIAALAADELQLMNKGINTSTILKFVSAGKRFKDPAEEPFALQNNRWRMRPSKKETDSAIRMRLKENLYFFILFYRSVIIKEDKHVSFWGLPSCYKWYGGGIYLKKKEELDENWIKCFYNNEQAMTAYQLGERLLSQKYEWPKNESNWLKLNLAVLEQMYKKIDELK